MTPQEVMKKFMARLANHGFSNSTDDIGIDMLDSAIRAASRFSSVQEVLDAFAIDQASAEREAVEEVLGSEYAGKLMSDLDADTLSGKENSIKSRKAYIFLEKYCGIQLNSKFGLISGGLCLNYGASGNVDTGAITGSDANITLKAGDTDFYGNEIDLSALAESYGLTLEEDGSLIIGSGTEKTERTIVDETFINTYTAATNAAQVINTGSRNWVVQATDADDTITAGGADSINAGSGDDSITVNGSGTTVTGGEGADTIEISAHVKDFTISDLSSEDVMTISGGFEVGAAKIEDMLLVITDKTGTRKLKLGEFTTALDGRLNVDGASTTISQWLSASGIKLDDLSAENNQDYSDQWLSSRIASDERIAPDDDYKPTPIQTTPATAPMELTEKPTMLYSRNTTSEAPTVNLDDFTALGDGDNVTVDGQNVGSVSSTFPATNTFTRNGLTIHLLGAKENGSDTITPQTYDQLTDSQKAIVAGLFKWWAADCLGLDEETYGISFNSDSAMIKEIGLYFYTNENSNAMAAVGTSQRKNSDGFAVMLTLNVNMKYYNNISATDADGDGKYGGKNSGFLDRALAHEFVHALMAANVNFFNSLPEFITEGTAELAHGIDDERGSSIFRLAYDGDALEKALALTSGTGTADAYSGGYMFLRYFAKQAALQTLLLPAFGDITANVDLSKFKENDVLYCDNEGNVSTEEGGILLGKIVDDIEVGGTGGDLIYLVNDSGVKQIINTYAGNFQVSGLTANTQIVGSDADEYAEVVEGATVVNMGAGNDFIKINGQYATINAGAGSDTVLVGEGSHHSINPGEGDNYLRIESKPYAQNNYTIGRNYANTILGGAGNDTLTNGNGVAALDADGNAYPASEVKVDKETGGYYVDSYGEQISVTAVHFYQFNYEQQIDLGEGDNYVKLSYVIDSALKTGSGLDQISIEYAQNSSIDSGAEGDLVSVGGGSEILINTDAGHDIVVLGNHTAENNSIYTGGDNDYVLFGTLNDSLKPSGYIVHDENLIDLGAGDDSIDFAGTNNTITAGAGSDLITEINGSAGGNHFVFPGSFGNDSIVGFLANDTIHLEKNFATELDENTLTVKRGDKVMGTITFQNAADLTQLNIVKSEGAVSLELQSDAQGNYLISSDQDLRDFADYVNDGNNCAGMKFKLNADLELPDDFSLNNFAGTLDGGNHLLTNVKANPFGTVNNLFYHGTAQLTGGTKVYTLSAPEYFKIDMATSANVTAFGGNFYLRDGDEAQVTLSSADGLHFADENYTVTINAADSTIAATNVYIQLDAAHSTYTNAEDNISILGTAGDDVITNTADDVTIVGGAGADKIILGSDVTTITIDDFATGDVLEFADSVTASTYEDGALKVTTGGKTVTINGLVAPAAVDANYSDGIYTSKGTTAGYSLSSDKKSVSYTKATTKTFEFEGIADGATASNFYLSGNTMTVGKAAVKTDGTPVKLLTDGYTLKLGRGMTESESVDALYSDGIYTSKGTTAGYNLSDDKKSVSYSSATTKTFEFEGIADGATASNFYLSGNTMTVGKAAVKTDGTPVKLLTEGYVLRLGRGMTEPESVDANYSDGIYTSKGMTAGYSLSSDKKSVSYSSATTKTFEFEGIADGATASNFYLSGNTLTVGKAAVQTNGTPVKLLTDGYTLKLGRGMTEPAAVDANYSDGIYTSKGTTAGYNLSSDKKLVSYSAATTKTFEFEGIADEATANNFYLSGNTMTVGKVAVKTDGTPVKLLTDGYTLKLGRGMTEPESVDANYSDGVYTTKGTTAGYSLSSDKKSVSYSAATTKTFEFEGISDGATASNFYLSGNTMTVGKTAVQTNGTPVKLLTDGYTLKLGRGMTAAASNAGTLKDGVYTFGGKTAGYSLSSDKKSISYTKASDSTLEMRGVASNLATPANKIVALEVGNFSENLSIVSNSGEFRFSVAAGDYSGKTFTGSASADFIGNSGSNLTINTGNGNDSIKSTGGSVKVNAGAGADTIAGSGGNDILDGDAGNDIIWAGKGNDSVFGGAGNDSLVGYAGSDTLWGGAGNDTLTGGAGNDTFIYRPNEGTDIITDYESGDMLQILKSDDAQGTFSDSSFSGNRLTLTIDGGSVIFNNVTTSTAFNINGTTYKINGSKLVRS